MERLNNSDQRRMKAFEQILAHVEGRGQQQHWRLLDVGCGTGEFLRYVINSRRVRHIVGLDVNRYKFEVTSRTSLQHSQYECKPNLYDHSQLKFLKSKLNQSGEGPSKEGQRLRFGGQRQAEVIPRESEREAISVELEKLLSLETTLYNLSITEDLTKPTMSDISSQKSHDQCCWACGAVSRNEGLPSPPEQCCSSSSSNLRTVATLIEVIEHVQFEELEMLNYNLFGVLRPDLVIMTTPNCDFNRFFGMKQGEMRHWDHKFEFSERQFLDYCRGVVRAYPDYTFETEGLGIKYTDERYILPEFLQEFQKHIITQVVCFRKVNPALKVISHSIDQIQEGIEVLGLHPQYFSCSYRSTFTAEPLSLTKDKNWWKLRGGQRTSDVETAPEEEGEEEGQDSEEDPILGNEEDEYMGYFENS